MNLYQKLSWLWRMGVDETIGETPQNRLAKTIVSSVNKDSSAILPDEILASKPHAATTSTPLAADGLSRPQRPPSDIKPVPFNNQPTFLSPGENAVHLAVTAAAGAATLDQLNQILLDFDACPLKKTAAYTLFSKGNRAAQIMCIGDMPDAEDDKQGTLYAGQTGLLLDKMLAAIGLNTTFNTYVSMLIPWRPPGGRKPTAAEIALCLPFIKRHIELVHPRILVLFGSLTSGAVLGIDSISRARGIWHDYQPESIPSPIPCLVTFSPAFLINSPAHKKHAWEDLKRLKEKIDAMNLL